MLWHSQIHHNTRTRLLRASQRSARRCLSSRLLTPSNKQARCHVTLRSDADTAGKLLGLNHDQLEQLLEASECAIGSLAGCNAHHVIPLLLTLEPSPQRVHVLIRNHPELLGVDLEGWVDFLQAYGVSRRDIFKLMWKNTELFTEGSVYIAGQVISFLQKLGLSQRSISATVLPACASLLQRSPEQLIAVTQFLTADPSSDPSDPSGSSGGGLGMSSQQLRQLLVRCPRLLAADIEHELVPRLEYLLGCGYTRRDVLAAVCEQGCVAMLLQDVRDTMAARTAFLTSSCGLSHAEAHHVLLRCPALLTLSIPNLQRKQRFLAGQMGLDAHDLLLYPDFFLKSLMVEIGPRYAFAHERGALGAFSAPCNGSGGEGQQRVSLSGLLDCPQAEYLALVGGGADAEGFEAFRQAWMHAEARIWSGLTGSGSW